MTDKGNLPLFAAIGHAGGMGVPQSEQPSAADSGAQNERSVESIIGALDAVLIDLERLIADRSLEELQRPAEDGGWGMVEILPHMRDWEEITHDRVWRILAEDRPELEEYDDSLWAIERDYSSQDPHQVFHRFTELRRELVERLRDLDDAAWQRTAVLEGHGEITLRSLMNEAVDHDADHLAQARDVVC